ncbi:hypothetical protein ACI65C_007443 [Semiaphis heraclei]
MTVSCFLCVLLTCVAISHGYQSNIDFKSKNDSVLPESTNDIGTSSTLSSTEFFDKEKKIIAHKNEMTKECVLKQMDNQANSLNFKNNYDQNMELTEDEMVEIIGENLRNFCKDKMIILNNFDNERFSRSKRSSDKKRYQGQTQTQFVSFGSKNSNQETKNGLAEALSQPDLSRATVSGLNGMGQAQSQSSFGECDDCSGQDYRTHSTLVDSSHPGHFQSNRPISSIPQSQNSRPYSESNENRQSPGSQNEEIQRGHSINDQYPNTYPGSRTSNTFPNNQVHGYGVEPSVDGLYPLSGTYNKFSGNQDRGYGTTPIDGQYSGSGRNDKLPSNQDHGYSVRPSVNGQYQESGTNNKLPGHQDQGYGTTPSTVGQYPGSGINNKSPDNQNQRYPFTDSQYPGSETNNKLAGYPYHGYDNVPSLYGQYPGKNQGSESNNNTELDKINSGHVYNSANEQNPNLANTNPAESKKVVNNDVVNPNTYSINSSPFNPSSRDYPKKITNNNPNIPSGSSHGILTPHYTPNSESTRPSYNPQVPVTNLIEHQNKLSNYPSSLLPNYQQQMPNVLGQLTPNKPISTDMKSQNEHNIKNGASGTIQNVYPLSSNIIYGGQDYTQLNLPSICNFLYQTCLNALSNNKRLNEFQITSSQNNERNPNERKQVSITQVPTIQQQGYHSYGGGNQNQIQPGFGQPQGTSGSGGSVFQQPGYVPPGGNVNQIQPNYGQSQGTLGFGGPVFQHPGYTPSGGNVNQIQPSYGQPQGTLGSSENGLQQPGYVQSGGNVNQMQPDYGQSQGTLGSGESVFQQPGYVPSGGNVNQIQPSYGQSQGTLGSGGSVFQLPGYVPSGGNINQIQPSYGQPQGTLDSGGSSFQQPGYVPSGGNVNQIQPSYGQSGYVPSGGNVNQIQPSYGQSQDALGSGGSSFQQPGYAPPGVNQVQPTYGQPQSTLGSGRYGVQKPGYIPSGGNVNQIQPSYGQPQDTLSSGGSGFQQPGYAPPGGNKVQPTYGQPQSTLGSGMSGAQQPGYVPSGGNVNQIQPSYGQSGYVPSGGNVNQIQPSYGQSQDALGSGGSSFQQPGYAPPGVNQVQPTYGQPQSTLGSGRYGVQKPGYIPSGGNVNQIQPSYGQPQDTLSSGGSGFQQPGYAPPGGNKVQPTYGQPQSTLGSGMSGAQQPGYVPSGGNGNQVQPTYDQPQGTLGSGGSSFQQPGYVPSGGNVNQIQPSYGQSQGTLGSGGSGVQQPGYNPSQGEPNQSGVSNVQSPSDGKREPQSYPESYGDNNFRGPSLKPGSEMENINPSINPIIGGQFGTDISSGGSVTLIDTEGGDAQSMTNVDVDGQETRASASAQGKSKTGMSQTQVSGSYLGTGTFSAQAQTSDSDKGAQSQIISNTNGTTSTAQGKGGRGQAQSQVLYNADNGIALGEAQSSGINYGTNTQLQAGIKGGVADAQSTGPGSTSSQAQIGFLPHESNNSTSQKSLFKGSGATSAQAGSYSGQSQSQLFGSYKHGISYNGAAQASSGKKLQNLPKLNLADAKLKIEQLEGSNNEVKNQNNTLQNLQYIPNLLRSQNRTEMPNVNNQKQQIISSTQTPSILPQESSKSIDIYPEYEDNDEYDEDSDEIVNTKSVQTNKETIPKQEQNIILKLDNKHDAQITRDSDSQLKSGQVLDAGQVIPGTNGTKIPNGFRGRIASVAGDQTEAKAIPGGQAQTQTVLLTPGVGSLTVVDKTKLRAQLNKESYVSPTNRFQSEINGGIAKLKPDKKNVQYFTKSSTCGYFSFSCNYVDGRKDGAKICKPNPPPSPCQKSYN